MWLLYVPKPASGFTRIYLAGIGSGYDIVTLRRKEKILHYAALPMLTTEPLLARKKWILETPGNQWPPQNKPQRCV